MLDELGHLVRLHNLGIVVLFHDVVLDLGTATARRTEEVTGGNDIVVDASCHRSQRRRPRHEIRPTGGMHLIVVLVDARERLREGLAALRSLVPLHDDLVVEHARTPLLHPLIALEHFLDSNFFDAVGLVVQQRLGQQLGPALARRPLERPTMLHRCLRLG